MTVELFEAILKKLEFPPCEYCLDASQLYRVDGVLVLEHKGPIWYVYYYERGKKSSHRFFFSKSSAINHMLVELLESHSFLF